MDEFLNSGWGGGQGGEGVDNPSMNLATFAFRSIRSISVLGILRKTLAPDALTVLSITLATDLFLIGGRSQSPAWSVRNLLFAAWRQVVIVAVGAVVAPILDLVVFCLFSAALEKGVFLLRTVGTCACTGQVNHRTRHSQCQSRDTARP